MRRSFVVVATAIVVVSSIVAFAATEYRGVNMALEMAHVADLEYLATNWNVNFVRICLNMAGDWGYFVPNPNSPTQFPESHWERLDRFLDDCEANGMRACIDLHQWLGYGYLNGQATTEIWRRKSYQDSFVEFWRLVAKRYADRGDVIYAYELMNEPHASYGGQDFADKWHLLAQRAVDAIRQYDSTHAIVVDCTDWGNPSGFEHLRPLDDDNIVYSFHMWVPHQFTHQGVNNQRSASYPSGNWNADWIRGQLSPVLEFRDKYNVRILVGEIGASASADPRDRAAYFEDCLILFEEYGFDYAQWCYAEWGLWSLEHIRNNVPGTLNVMYGGESKVLSVYRSFLARNEQPHVAVGPRPRCLFDRSGSHGSWEYSIFGGDLLWKLSHVFDVAVADEEISEAALEGVDVLVLGSARDAYTPSEVEAIDTFVRIGGGLLHHGPRIGNGLENWMASAGITVLGGAVVSEPNEWDLGSYFCHAIPSHEITQDVLAFQTNWAAGLELGDGAVALVWSPEESWIDWDHDGIRDSGEPQGPFPLAAAQLLDEGRVVVLGDDAFNLTTNYAITFGAAIWLANR